MHTSTSESRLDAGMPVPDAKSIDGTDAAPSPSQNHEPLFVHPQLLSQAEQLFQRRLERSPEDAEALQSLIQVFRKQGRLEEALTVLQRLLQVAPHNEWAVHLHAILSGDLPPYSLRPAPFVLQRDFLTSELHSSLLPYVLSVQDEFTAALVGENVYNPEHRISLDLPGPRDIKASFREAMSEFLPEARTRLPVDPFTIDRIEVKVRAYLDGHFFKAHMDCPQNRRDSASRMLSYVYFFHKTPREYSGGDLLLFDTDVQANRYTTSSLTRIVPESNSLVIFPSAFWHSVVPLSCPSGRFEDSRFVINGHIHRKVKTLVEGGAAAGEEENAPAS